MNKVFLTTLLLILSLTSLKSFAKTTVVVVSIDGFAHKYLLQYQPPQLLNIARQGVMAHGLIPVYPTKTFPNHVSIATGNYPENHGILHNDFYRSDIDKFYRPAGEIEDNRWIISEPIWTIIEKNNRKSAIYFWPASEATISSVLPSIVMPFSRDTSNSKRIDGVISWLEMADDNRPELIMAYLSDVDSSGHKSGPSSKNLQQAIKEVDSEIGRLYRKILTLDGNINLIIVSDHGMVNTGSESLLEPTALFESLNKSLANNLNIINGETQLFIYAKNPKAYSEVRSHLTNLQKDNSTNKEKQQFEIFFKEKYPKHWHYDSKEPFIPDVVINAIPPYTFKTKYNQQNKATHGFDPKAIDLNGIFIANGPSFKEGEVIEPFENIHIFPMLLKLLNINYDKAIDGQLSVLAPIVK